MIARYVWADLVRNPRRTLSTMVGVLLGVGLFSAVLFFVDGLSASMTQRAVAPLAIDMQRVVTLPLGSNIELTQRLDREGQLLGGDTVRVSLQVRNIGKLPTNEVVVRSVPPTSLSYLARSAMIDGSSMAGGAQENPFAVGPARVGHNLGTLTAGETRTIEYTAAATTAVDLASTTVRSSFSTRESLTPTEANGARPRSAADLANDIKALPGIEFAEPLSFADLAPRSLVSGTRVAQGPVRVFGFRPSYTERDTTIEVVQGTQQPDQALISAEAAAALGIAIGDSVTIALPDASSFSVRVSGTVDLSRARVLFASRKGADFETFAYVSNSVILDPSTFGDRVVPAFERTATTRGQPLRNPPVNEVDVGVRRDLLNVEPGAALGETRAIALAVTAVASHQDYLIDNISNTLAVARDDAGLGKRMFIFLGVPGALLAAMLASYAGSVLAVAQRKEQATLRVRGASRRHLLAMLGCRVGAITIAGSLAGVALGYLSAVVVLGHATLTQATTRSLVVSGLIGTVGGLLSTGAALYLMGRRSIDRGMNADTAGLAPKAPVWRRLHLDVVGLVLLGVGTAVAIKTSAFDGTPGSVYSGRATKLPLALLMLPIAAWITGILLASRGFGRLLRARRSNAPTSFGRPLRTLYRLSIRRRSWAVSDGVVVVALIVALGTSLSLLTTSYNTAKAADARYVVGSDLRVSPKPTSDPALRAVDAAGLTVDGVDAVTPIVYGVHNVVLRSRRTEELSSLAAIDPTSFAKVAPLIDGHFPAGSASGALDLLRDDPAAILLSSAMADFLRAGVGDPIRVLLARGTDAQTETELHLVGLFDRLPGFPDGADALMNITRHKATVPTSDANFYLVRTVDRSDAGLARAVVALQHGPGAGGAIQIETRAAALAKDQSSLAALNIQGLLQLDSGYALAMSIVAIAIFVFGLLLQRRREYVTLRAQGMPPRSIRYLVVAEAATVAVGGAVCGVIVGTAMAFYFVNVLRSLFVLAPPLTFTIGPIVTLIGLVFVATVVSSLVATSLVNRLRATELLRDE